MHSWISLVLATGLLRSQKAAVLKELEAGWFVKGFFTRISLPERYAGSLEPRCPAVTDDEWAVPVAVPVCVCTGTWTLLSHPTPPHPSSSWWWKSSACCRACVCTGTWTLLSHPTPPHPSSSWWWKSSACCRACVCTGTWTLLSHPTPPLTWTFWNLTAASDWFWIVLQESYCCKWSKILLPQVIESYCRKWRLNHIYWYCDSHRSICENVDISWYLGTTTLCFWSLQWLPCPRMVWPEAPGETGPTTQHLLCAPSRMNSACRRPWVSGIPQVSRPTEAWKTSSDVVLPRSSMVAFRCWPPWDTSPQWLGNAGAAFKIVSIQYVFC